MRGKSSGPSRAASSHLAGSARVDREGSGPDRVKLKRASTANAALEDLAVELYAVVGTALESLGVGAASQRRAMRRALGLAGTPAISGPLLRDTRALSELLLAWSREQQYLDPSGRPRVLAIAGRGATFESLAMRMFPGLPLAEVVARACATAEVATRPGRRIALLGGLLVNTAHSAEHHLAHAVRQIDQLLAAIVHNARVRKRGVGEGHVERMILSVVTRTQFDELMQELRPQINEFLQRVDSAVQPWRPTTRRALKRATTVSIGLYVSRDDDCHRAGIDTDSLAPPTARRRAPR